MYFNRFGKVKYDFTRRTDATQTIETLQDVSAKVNLFITPESMEELCQRYTVLNGELPEHVSFKFYNTPDLAWTIMYINKLGDLNTEWPMSDVEVNKFAKSKYGADKLNDLHHCEKLPERIVMDKNFILDTYGADALMEVSNIDHETLVNDQKRYIYVIKPMYVGRFVSLFESKLA